MDEKSIIEKINAEYLEVTYSRDYKLGSIVSNVGDGIRHFDFGKIRKHIKLLWQGMRLQKYNSKKERYKELSYSGEIKKTAVYMALFGGYDEIYEPVVVDENCDYFIFTEQEINSQSIWKKVELSEKEKEFLAGLTNAERNRYFKMVGYKKFSDYEYSIYIDTNLEVYGDLSKLSVYAKNPSGIAMYNHPARGCVYNEAKACVILGKAKKKPVEDQVKVLKQAGMPANYGMCECNVIVRENANKKCEKLMNEWWEEFRKSTAKRDQLLFPYVLWKNNTQLDAIGCLGENIDCDGKFRRKSHTVK